MTAISERMGLIAVCKARPDRLEEVRELLLPTVPWATAKTGCLEYVLNVDRDDPAVFVFYEVWLNRSALDDHRSSPEFLVLIEKLRELLVEPAQVTLLERIA